MPGCVCALLGLGVVKWHEVASNSGNVHFNWQILPANKNNPPFYAQVQPDGTFCEYKNGGPIGQSFHLGKGETLTWIGNEQYKSETGDWLRWFYRTHYTINSNGELTAERESETFECLHHGN
ncbi:MAG: hypothetical protein ACYSVY_21965 [Planctomycetota bacterium]